MICIPIVSDSENLPVDKKECVEQVRLEGLACFGRFFEKRDCRFAVTTCNRVKLFIFGTDSTDPELTCVILVR